MKIQSAVGILNTKSGILLVKRKDTDRTYTGWCLPGGKSNINENPELTVIREFFEETEVVAKPINLIAIKENDKFVINFYEMQSDDISVFLNYEELDDYGFFKINELPNELLPLTKQVLHESRNNWTESFN